jgi:hypothetical protein
MPGDYFNDQGNDRFADPEPDGVWAVAVLGSDGLYVNEVHPTELEALRAAVAQSATVQFLPFGVPVYEAVKR